MKRRWVVLYHLGQLLSSLLLSNRLAALTLEVYYRYANVFGGTGGANKK